MSSPMRPLMKLGHRPHPIDTKRYGQPRLALYWAGRHFTRPGLWIWTGKHNRRIVPTLRKHR